MDNKRDFEEKSNLTEKDCVDCIIVEKRIAKPWDLVKETHAKGKAWDLVYNNGLGDRKIIPKGLLKSNG